MTEPNHDLTDSEAQAFQPEPHVMHLLRRAARRVAQASQTSSSDEAADGRGTESPGRRSAEEDPPRER